MNLLFTSITMRTLKKKKKKKLYLGNETFQNKHMCYKEIDYILSVLF
jgi:hypothetical protein